MYREVEVVPGFLTSTSLLAGVKAAASSESMVVSLAAAMLACCAGLLLDRLVLAGSGLGFAALCASAMASLAGIATAKQGQPTNTFAGKVLHAGDTDGFPRSKWDAKQGALPLPRVMQS